MIMANLHCPIIADEDLEHTSLSQIYATLRHVRERVDTVHSLRRAAARMFPTPAA
jgi:hypothetical protein